MLRELNQEYQALESIKALEKIVVVKIRFCIKVVQNLYHYVFVGKGCMTVFVL